MERGQSWEPSDKSESWRVENSYKLGCNRDAHENGIAAIESEAYDFAHLRESRIEEIASLSITFVYVNDLYIRDYLTSNFQFALI